MNDNHYTKRATTRTLCIAYKSNHCTLLPNHFARYNILSAIIMKKFTIVRAFGPKSFCTIYLPKLL